MVTAEQGRGTFVKSIKLWEATFHLQALQKLFSDDSDTRVKMLETSIVPAALLKAPSASAAFLLEHISFDFQEKPVWGWFVCPGDRFRLATMIGSKANDRN